MSFINGGADDPRAVMRRAWNWLIAAPSAAAPPPPPPPAGNVSLMLHFDTPADFYKDSGPDNLTISRLSEAFIEPQNVNFVSSPNSAYMVSVIANIYQGVMYQTFDGTNIINPGLNLSTGDFTIEGSLYQSSLDPVTESAYMVCSHGNKEVFYSNNANIQFGFIVSELIGWQFKVCVGAAEFSVVAPFISTFVAPYHFALQRRGDVIELFLNGALQGATALPANAVLNTPNDIEYYFAFGGTLRSIPGWIGWYDELRVTKSAALYPVSGYVPSFPLTPLTAI